MSQTDNKICTNPRYGRQNSERAEGEIIHATTFQEPKPVYTRRVTQRFHDLELRLKDSRKRNTLEGYKQ